MPRKGFDSYWFRFYPDKYLGGTAGFSFEMHGAYWLMLIHQWGSGPFSEEYALSTLGSLWEKIKHKFVKTDQGYANVRMSEESEHKRNVSKSRSEAVQMRYKQGTIVPEKGTNVVQTVYVSSSSDSSLNSQDSDARKKGRNIPPPIEEIEGYCEFRENEVDPQNFFNYYEARGWMLGKVKMKNWQAAIRTWEKNENHGKLKKVHLVPADMSQYPQRD